MTRASAGTRAEVGGAVRALDLLLLGVAFTSTFTKIYWQPAGKLTLASLLMILFVVGFAGHIWERRERRIPRHVAAAGLFSAAFAAVYLTGFFNLGSDLERVQFAKGFIVSVLQLAFMVAAAWHLSLRGRPLMFACLAAFVGGLAVNALYGFAQFALWMLLRVNLDELVVVPLTFGQGGAGGVNQFGGGVYRLTALMRDPNHLGVALAAPIAIALMWLRGWWRTGIVAVLFAAMLLTLSRSGALALVGALAVLAFPQRRVLLHRSVLLSVAAVIAGALAFRTVLPELTQALISSRLDLQGNSVRIHLGLYELVPDLLSEHPLFGLGLNTFAIHFEQLSGRTDFGPHSYFVRLLAETGLMGLLVFLGFAAYVVTMLRRLRDPLALAIMAAAVGTWLGNIFYLTTHIPYVAVLYALAFAAPAVLGVPIQSTAHERHHRAPARTSGILRPDLAERP